MKAEHRRHPRKKASQAIPVSNAMTGVQIGVIGDLSIDGMMLVTNQPTRENALLQLQFHLPDARGVPHAMEVGVHQQWTAMATGQARHFSGFRIIDIGPADREALSQWLDRGAFAAH
jgi:PilZ domain